MTTPARDRRESVLARRVLLADLLDLTSFQELAKSFVELYRLGIKVFDERGAKLVDLKVGSAEFCAYLFSFPDGRTRCTATVGRVKDGSLDLEQGAPSAAQLAGGHSSSVSMGCFSGLRYLVAPIVYDGDVLGRVVFGPFIPEELRGLPLSLLDISEQLDPEKAKYLMDCVRRAPEGTVARVLAHFLQMLEALVAAGYKTYLTSQLHIEATLEANRELEKRNHELLTANERLKELDRLKSSFLATVSHELRTPLTSIIGYSEMLAEGMAGRLNNEQLSYVRTIMDKGETLLRLISSILDLSQIEAGKVRMNFESQNVADVLSGSVSSVLPQAQKRGVQIELQLAQPEVRAIADREKLRQVVVNLLANAVKFTPKGGKVTVFLSASGSQPELGQDGYRIVVEDSGVGIPQEQFDNIFETFYQVDSSSTREFGGAGLGLSIVKSFVEAHAGTVRVASELNHGSRFSVVLPLAPPVAPAAPLAAAPAPPPVEDCF